MNTTRLRYQLTASAIDGEERKTLYGEELSGNIYWLVRRLKDRYGIELSMTQARRLAKKSCIFLTNKSIKTKFIWNDRSDPIMDIGVEDELEITFFQK